MTVRAKASRQLQFAWRARANDSRFAANGYLTLKARSAGSLRARPKAVRVGRSVSLRGRLKGDRRGSVPVVLQGKLRGAKRFTRSPTRRRAGAARSTPATVPHGGFARARVRVPRPDPPRTRLPVRDGLTRTVRVRVR